MPIHLRPAVEGDCRLLWEWANDPGVRASAFSPDPITWEVHTQWFDRKLRDSRCWIFIAEDAAGEAIGQIRFDVDERGEGEVDFSIAKDRRGKGYGLALLRAAVQSIFDTAPVIALCGLVKLSNGPSRRAFEATGFEAVGERLVKGTPVVEFRRGRPRDQGD